MNLQFLQSWRGALMIAALVTLGMTAYKAVFGPDPATRIAESRMARLLPGGQPSQDMLNRQIAAARPFVSARITLGQLATYMRSLNYEITWEAVDVNAFVMRATGEDALTRQSEEYAVQFIVLDGPVRDGRVIGTFEGTAVGIDSMAYNRQTVTDEEIVQFLLHVISELSPAPVQ